MTRLTITIVILGIKHLLAVENLTAESEIINPVVLSGGSPGSCVAPEERQTAIERLESKVKRNIIVVKVRECGDGLWYPVASLDMTDPQQQCPTGWREYNESSARACGRPVTHSGSCPATSYATSCQYSKVCGRAIGYQIGSPDAFGNQAISQPIDSYYVYGVSITHGTPRNHIWTYAAGISEGRYKYQGDNCPCSNISHPDNRYPPSFVGNNYYCESGNPTDTFAYNHLYSDDRLWDGHQCEGECCSNGKSPPWFSVELPNPITDDIEVRICLAEDNRDEILVQLLELYIQ